MTPGATAKGMLSALVGASAVLLLVSCATSAVVDEDAVREEALSAYASYGAHLNAGELDSAGAFVADDSRFRWYEDGVIRYRTPTDLREALQAIAAYGHIRVRADEPNVIVLSPDNVWLSTMTSTEIGPGDSVAFAFEAAVTLVMIRTTAGWKMLAGHSSTARPAEW